MYKRKTATPVPIALVASLAIVLAACGGNGTSPPQQALPPAATSGIGEAAAAFDVSGEFSGTANDSVFGAGRASIELSQYHRAAGGVLTLTFGSTAFITPLSYAANGRSLNGTDNYQISASSGVCAFTEAATYKDGQLNGSYQAVTGCSNDHGTFKTKQTCRFSRSMGANFALKPC